MKEGLNLKLKSHHFTNVITATFLLFIYSLIGKFLFPKGVNLVFAKLSSKYFLLFFILLVVAFCIFLVVRKSRIHVIFKKIERIQGYELVYMLIPMTPVIQYIVLNREMLYISSIITIIVFLSLLSFVFCIVFPFLLSCIAPRYILISAGTAFLYLIFSMVSLSVKFGWNMRGRLRIQLLVLLIALLILLLSKFLPKKILIGAVILNLLLNSASSFYIADPVAKTQKYSEQITVGKDLLNEEIKKTSDIFLLVYESYTDYQTMKHYGYDNGDQQAFLEERGFHIYKNVYSLSMPTLPSMSNVFDIDSNIIYNRQSVTGSGNVQKILKNKGYKLYGIFCNDYFFIKNDLGKIKFDYFFPSLLPLKEDRLLIKSIITGRFFGHAGSEPVDHNSYLGEVEKIIKYDFKEPLFLYAHNLYPGHSPPEGITPDKAEAYIDWYKQQVDLANLEMRKEIDLILKHNPDAIVIIAGDHGPSLTKSGYKLRKGMGEFTTSDIDRYDLGDRYGTFLAIRWPEKDYATKHNIGIFQDIFPAVFSYLFEDDEIFNKIRMERKLIKPEGILGVSVENGIITGGLNDGEPLFPEEE